MALPLPPGLTPSEVAFLCEMEAVTVIPRQRLEGLELLGGTTQPLNPPFPTPLPLWLALLLKRQKRANITPPPWLTPSALTQTLDFETDTRTAALFSPDALPYHWLELGHLLLTHAADDFDDADAVRRLLRDLREVRMSKLRKGFRVLDAGAGVKMNGVGGMEIAEVRGFVGGVVDGLRKINRSREESRREREDDEDGEDGYQDDEDDMQL